MSGAMTPEYLDDLIRRALAEDAPWGDVTSEVFVPADARATATLSSREPGVLSGLTVFARVFQIVDASIGIDLLARDGDAVKLNKQALVASRAMLDPRYRQAVRDVYFSREPVR